VKLVTYGAAGAEKPGLVVGDDVVSLVPILESVAPEHRRDLIGVIAAWPSVAKVVGGGELRGMPRERLADVRLGPPLTRPEKIVGVGSNYRSAEGSQPYLPAAPIFFLKPCSSLIGPGEPVVLPSDANTVVGEVELAIVIGKPGRRISESEAMEHVFGYTIGNDITSPDVLLGESGKNALFLQAARGKGYPTFCPLGPWIVTKDEVDDLGGLLLEQEIDGKIVAAGHTSLMIFSVAKLVSEASKAFGIEAGDIILSGSPRSDSGHMPLKAGNRLRTRISGIGELTNPVLAERDDDPDGPRRGGPSVTPRRY
jgi:2,4-didehydro-3-deoxy-L-rhamnonate hydrolase